MPPTPTAEAPPKPKAPSPPSARPLASSEGNGVLGLGEPIGELRGSAPSSTLSAPSRALGEPRGSPALTWHEPLGHELPVLGSPAAPQADARPMLGSSISSGDVAIHVPWGGSRRACSSSVSALVGARELPRRGELLAECNRAARVGVRALGALALGAPAAAPAVPNSSRSHVDIFRTTLTGAVPEAVLEGAETGVPGPESVVASSVVGVEPVPARNERGVTAAAAVSAASAAAVAAPSRFRPSRPSAAMWWVRTNSYTSSSASSRPSRHCHWRGRRESSCGALVE